jgi:aconitate hydratase
MTNPNDQFGARSTLSTSGGDLVYYSLRRLETEGGGELNLLPYSIRILLEALLRQCDGVIASQDDVVSLSRWPESVFEGREVAFVPARVLLQDFTGVPAIVDLAALRSAMRCMGGRSSAHQSAGAG